MLNVEELEQILRSISDHARVKEKLQFHRDVPGHARLIETISGTLQVVVTAVALFSATKMDASAKTRLLAVLVLLAELTVVLEREMLSDADVKSKMTEAWSQVRGASDRLAIAAQHAVDMVKGRSEEPT